MHGIVAVLPEIFINELRPSGSNLPAESSLAHGTVNGPEDLSLLLHTSGTTGRPIGVPRHDRAERAAALAHAVRTSARRNSSS
jgi:acyl-coenzyme A synthetase/AMP-(fatty) acid ligase